MKTDRTTCYVTSITYSNMGNYGKMENFLADCREGKSGTVTIYEIHSDGGIGREKYISLMGRNFSC